jgi:hypothetical protein
MRAGRVRDGARQVADAGKARHRHRGPIFIVGAGFGGGVYLGSSGSSDTPQFAVVGNKASTADNDIFGAFN